jgi:hypothetical protein
MKKKEAYKEANDKLIYAILLLLSSKNSKKKKSTKSKKIDSLK